MADFGVSSLVRLLDVVKVISFAVEEGRVAIHCHAGLGRTGRSQNYSNKVMGDTQPIHQLLKPFITKGCGYGIRTVSGDSH